MICVTKVSPRCVAQLSCSTSVLEVEAVIVCVDVLCAHAPAEAISEVAHTTSIAARRQGAVEPA